MLRMPCVLSRAALDGIPPHCRDPPPHRTDWLIAWRRQAASVERVGIRWGPLRRFKGAQPYGYESFVGRSLGILPTSSWLRRVCYEIADDKRFDMFMMLMIFASSISIAVETPWMVRAAALKNVHQPHAAPPVIEPPPPPPYPPQDAEKELILLVLDIIFTTFFCIEMAVKAGRPVHPPPCPLQHALPYGKGKMPPQACTSCSASP